MERVKQMGKAMFVFRPQTIGERPAHMSRGNGQALGPGNGCLQTMKETLSLHTPLLLVLCLAKKLGDMVQIWHRSRRSYQVGYRRRLDLTIRDRGHVRGRDDSIRKLWVKIIIGANGVHGMSGPDGHVQQGSRSRTRQERRGGGI